MGSSTSKGNISTLLLVITLLALIVSLGILAELMVSDRVRAGKYVNPYVAGQVIRGTIYDRNGRALALEVPQQNVLVKTPVDDENLISQILSIHIGKTPGEILAILRNHPDETFVIAKDIPASDAAQLSADLDKASIPSAEVSVVKEHARTFPAAFHAAQLIEETEQAFDHVLSPIPGFNQTTTYGSDVYLTIDLDIQYLLDLALQQVYEVQSPEYCVAFIADATTSEILAATTYPFYDLNDSSTISAQQKISRALLSSLSSSDIRLLNIRPVLRVTEHDTVIPVDSYQMDRSYTFDLDIIRERMNKADGRTAIVKAIPEKEKKYVIFIASVNPKFHQNSYVMDAAIKSIETGLSAQSKI